MIQRGLNILFILVICAVLIGGYLYQYLEHEVPCPLCLLQRLGMIGVATALCMNLRFGIKVQHYGLAIISALTGRLVALRQITMHLCPELPTHGAQPILGFDLFVWSYMVFTCSIFASAVLLIIHGFSKQQDPLPYWNWLDKCIFALVFAMAAANTITTATECGFTLCGA